MQKRKNEIKTERTMWFKTRKNGWGWNPVSWQGWAILASYVILLVYDFMFIDASQHSVSDTLINFAPRFIILSLVLVALCYWRGDKSPKWVWAEE